MKEKNTGREQEGARGVTARHHPLSSPPYVVRDRFLHHDNERMFMQDVILHHDKNISGQCLFA